MGRKTIVVKSYLPVLLVLIVFIYLLKLTNHVVENEQKKQ